MHHADDGARAPAPGMDGGAGVGVRVRLLGPVTLEVDGVARPLGGRRPTTLFAVLALEADRPVPVTAITAALYGDEPIADPVAALRSHVSRLRSAIAPLEIAARGGGYVLRVDPGCVDALAVDVALDAARDPDRAEAALVALADHRPDWPVRPLLGTVGTPVVDAERERLEQLALTAAAAHGRLLLDGGDAPAAVAVLEPAHAQGPLHEPVAAALVRALAAAGEQQAALEQYRVTRQRLADELGLEPSPALRSAHLDALSLAPGGTEPAGNLPAALTSFVGRAEELVAVDDLLDVARLVTLTGPAGCGKTRLALEVASRRATAPELDGPWLVELAGLAEPALVASAVAQTLRVTTRTDEPALDSLATALAARRVWLVLDNCEHLAEAVARVLAVLLARCPGVQVLATSREPVGVAGERVLVVPPLPVSGGADAVRLFTDRARTVDPGFALDPRTEPAVAAVCRELDGMPLAIELAAAQLSAFGLPQLRELLQDRFALLTSPNRTVEARHRTLEAAVAWSIDLLDDRERALYLTASVFRGGFGLDALVAVHGEGARPAAVAATLRALVEQSIVQTDAGRYHLLETLREYAERTLDPAEAEALSRRRDAWVVALTAEADAHLRGPDEVAWVAVLRRETGNIRAALAHALDSGAAEDALRIAARAAWWWTRRGSLAEGARWLDRAIDAAPHAPAGLRALALAGRSHLAYFAGDLHLGLAFMRRAAALLTDAGIEDPDLRVHTTGVTAFFAASFGDLAEAEAMAATGRPLLPAPDAALDSAVSVTSQVVHLVGVAQIARRRGDLAAALATLQDAARRAGAGSDRWGDGYCAWFAAKVHLDLDRPRDAAVVLATAITREMRAQVDMTGLLAQLLGMAAAAARLGHAHRGAQLLGAVETLGQRIGYRAEAMDPDGAAIRALVQRALPARRFAEAVAEGRVLHLAEAVEVALAVASAD